MLYSSVLLTNNTILVLRKILAGIYLFKVINENTITMCEICSKLTTIKTPEQCHLRVVLVSLLLTLIRFKTLF